MPGCTSSVTPADRERMLREIFEIGDRVTVLRDGRIVGTLGGWQGDEVRGEMAGLVAAGLAPKAMEPKLGGLTGEVAALLVGLAICAFLLRGGRDSGKAA